MNITLATSSLTQHSQLIFHAPSFICVVLRIHAFISMTELKWMKLPLTFLCLVIHWMPESSYKVSTILCVYIFPNERDSK